MDKQRSSDRRREPRFRPEIELYAVVRGDSRKLGSVIDFSMTGLAFQYIETSKGVFDHSEIDVFSVGRHFRIVGDRRTHFGAFGSRRFKGSRCGNLKDSFVPPFRTPTGDRRLGSHNRHGAPVCTASGHGCRGRSPMSISFKAEYVTKPLEADDRAGCRSAGRR